MNVNLHYHVVFLKGVYLDRPDQGRKPRFLAVEPPTDTDIADVIQKISHRVIRGIRLRRDTYMTSRTERHLVFSSPRLRQGINVG